MQMRSRTLALAACAVVAVGCFSPVTEGDAGGGGGGGGGTAGGAGGGPSGGGAGGGAGGGGAVSECAADGECVAGQRCYVCGPSQPGQCLQGCSASHPCPAGQACRQLGIACFTCPCIDSICEGATCVDDDGDGYVAGAGCSGLPGGDCAPLDANINPGAGERCANGLDDDCDGLVDASDPDCGPPMCMGAPPCLTSWNCGLGQSQCVDPGCCQSCPVYAPPRCLPGECTPPSTIEPGTGCRLPPTCVTCPGGACPAVYAPVCASLSARGLDPRTFGNSCEATSFGATIIHAGECVTGEGLNCGSFLPSPGCGPGTELYCRDACPECDVDLRRCTAKGACLRDTDCPAGLPPPPTRTCANGTVSQLRCVANSCVQVCP